MPVMVIWQRGNKKANSKKRLIKEDSPTAEFEEKFQINTQMDVDANGKPNKPKMSTLTVASDKTRGILPMKGFEDAPDGSWFVSMLVENDEVWQQVKEGKINGFSIEGIFNYTPKLSKDEVKMQKIKDILSSIKA